MEDSASPGCFLLVGFFIDPLSVMSVLSSIHRGLVFELENLELNSVCKEDPFRDLGQGRNMISSR